MARLDVATPIEMLHHLQVSAFPRISNSRNRGSTPFPPYSTMYVPLQKDLTAVYINIHLVRCQLQQLTGPNLSALLGDGKASISKVVLKSVVFRGIYGTDLQVTTAKLLLPSSVCPLPLTHATSFCPPTRYQSYSQNF